MDGHELHNDGAVERRTIKLDGRPCQSLWGECRRNVPPLLPISSMRRRGTGGWRLPGKRKARSSLSTALWTTKSERLGAAQPPAVEAAASGTNAVAARPEMVAAAPIAGPTYAPVIVRVRKLVVLLSAHKWTRPEMPHRTLLGAGQEMENASVIGCGPSAVHSRRTESSAISGLEADG